MSAANDERGPGQRKPGEHVAPRVLPAGWDPFEIWRTRVRDARRDAPPPPSG